MKNMIVKDKIINVKGFNDDDYVSLTDIVRFKTDGETNLVIANWIRKVDTLEFLKLWEQINNINFKPTDFEGFVNGSIVIMLESKHLYLIIQTIVNLMLL